MKTHPDCETHGCQYAAIHGAIPDIQGLTLNELADKLVQRAPQMVNDADGCLAILASQVIRWLAVKLPAAAAINAADIRAIPDIDSAYCDNGAPPPT